MSIDPSRYGFITNEYRWATQYNGTIAAAYSKARELDIPSNLDLGKVSSLLSEMFAVVGVQRRRFAIDLIGTDHFTVDSFINVVPARYLVAPEYNVSLLAVIVTRMQIIESDNMTSIEVWG